MKRPVFERWGNAVMNCNYSPFKRFTGERERGRIKLPCGRSVCARCNAACCGRLPMHYTVSPAV